MSEVKLLDVTRPEFQVQSRLIHVEDGDGYTLHRHTDKVPFGEFLRSVNMGMEGGCFLVNNGAEDGEQKYCNDSDDKLRVFVNGKEFENPQPIVDYIFEDNDKILVIIENETSSEIKNELDTLNQNFHPENPKLRRTSGLQIANTQYPRDHTDLIQTIQILSYHW